MTRPVVCLARVDDGFVANFHRVGRGAVGLWLATILCLMVPAALLGQDADSGGVLTLKTSTSIVLLDVVVTDHKGNPVTNLKESDFHISEDGVPQTIRSFSAPEEHVLAPSRGLVVNSTADLTKIGNAPVTLLVLDELNTAFADMAYTRNRMEKYLLAQPPILPQPTTLLVVTNTKFQVIRDYTQDRAALLDALHKHFPEFPWKMMKSGGNSSAGLERVSQSLRSLYDISQASIGTPGRKSVIWVGVGAPSINLIGMDDKQTDILQGAMKQLTASMLKSRMTLYTIDPTVNVSDAGYVETVDDLATYESNNDGQPFADEIKFSTLAPATGGRAFFSRNDIDAEVATSVAQGASYYTLSYSPTNKSTDAAKYRQIRVTMNDPNLMASTRDGYFKEPEVAAATAVSASPASTKAELEAEMGEATMTNVAYNGLNASAAPGAAGNYRLSIVGGNLQWADIGGGKTRAEITVIVAAFNAKGKVLDHKSVELSAAIQGQLKDPTQKAVFNVAFTAPPGTARLRFVARDALSKKLGTADLKP